MGDQLGWQCSGITCNRQETSCTVRASKSPGRSPRGEVTYQKLFLAGYKRLPGQYLSGYAANDRRARNKQQSKVRCDQLGARCGGITCNRHETSCTVRSSKTPGRSSSGEVTYWKPATERSAKQKEKQAKQAQQKEKQQ